MKTNHVLASLMAPAAALAFAVNCDAAPSTTFYPSATAYHFEPKASTGDIQILSSAPSDNTVILGELSIDGGSDSSLHDLMVAALGVAMNKGADFVALSKSDTRPGLVLGKMVPVGHGRSMFVASAVQGSEINRIAAIPSETAGPLRVVIGRYAK